MMGEIELVEHLANRLIDDVLYVLGAMIERWGWREYGAAHFSNADHVLEMAQMKRGLSGYHNQPTSFLERDICCAGQQVVVKR